ncbi:hypothetical protein ABH944_002016 [Caballeronia udeis]|jgi:hypothetical protein|uniref:Uncharacterized protein n=1 Tax=Caballeronia udeis TaxID=1232866 RepID=A0ABW8MGC6_9BURK
METGRVKQLVEGADGPGVAAETVLQADIAACPTLRYTAGGLVAV